MAYVKKEWFNKSDDGTIPDGAIPLNADNLNRIESGIEEAVNKVNIGEFYTYGETSVKLGYKPKYLTAISDDGSDSFSIFQTTQFHGCSLTDDGFVINATEEEITNVNLSDYFTVNNETYFFEYDNSTDKFVSNNKNKHSTTAETKLTAKKNMEIEFKYGCSSEDTHDKFSIYICNENNEKLTTIADKLSGAKTEKIYRGTIGKGESIVFTYSKDSSSNGYEDQAYFKNLRGKGLKDGRWSYMAIK